MSPPGPNLRTQLLRYLLVGGLAVAIDAAVYAGLVAGGFATPAWVKRISFAAGAVWGFFANKYFTFGQRALSLKEPFVFALVYLGGWFLNSVTHDAVLRWGGSKSVAFLLATTLSTCTNFAGQKWLVFRQKSQRNPGPPK